MEIYESEREQRLKYLSLSGFSQAFLQIDGQLTVEMIKIVSTSFPLPPS